MKIKSIVVAALLAVSMTIQGAENYTDTLKAAKAGNVEAQHLVAMMYKFGSMGAPQHYAKSVYWFTKLANAGDTKAQTKLAIMYILGHGVKKDDSESAYWFAKACAAGDKKACGVYRHWAEQRLSN